MARGLGHDPPCPAEAAVAKCAANCLPRCCRPGVHVGRLEMVTAARRHRDRAKLAALPIVHPRGRLFAKRQANARPPMLSDGPWLAVQLTHARPGELFLRLVPHTGVPECVLGTS